MIDGHCHLVGFKPENICYAKLTKILENYARVNIVGTNPQDWKLILRLKSELNGSDKVTFALGLHPWYIKSIDHDWKTELKTLLIQNPEMNVGECGLDKVFKCKETNEKCSMIDQLKVFQIHVDLAIELKRTLIIHCVRAHSELYKLFSKLSRLPIKIYFHSWSGNLQQTKQFLRLVSLKRFIGTKLYFGFSAAINFRQVDLSSPNWKETKNWLKFKDVAQNVAQKMLMIETDLPLSHDEFTLDQSLSSLGLTRNLFAIAKISLRTEIKKFLEATHVEMFKN